LTKVMKFNQHYVKKIGSSGVTLCDGGKCPTVFKSERYPDLLLLRGIQHLNYLWDPKDGFERRIEVDGYVSKKRILELEKLFKDGTISTTDGLVTIKVVHFNPLDDMLPIQGRKKETKVKVPLCALPIYAQFIREEGSNELTGEEVDRKLAEQQMLSTSPRFYTGDLDVTATLLACTHCWDSEEVLLAALHEAQRKYLEPYLGDPDTPAVFGEFSIWPAFQFMGDELQKQHYCVSFKGEVEWTPPEDEPLRRKSAKDFVAAVSLPGISCQTLIVAGELIGLPYTGKCWGVGVRSDIPESGWIKSFTVDYSEDWEVFSTLSNEQLQQAFQLALRRSGLATFTKKNWSLCQFAVNAGGYLGKLRKDRSIPFNQKLQLQVFFYSRSALQDEKFGVMVERFARVFPAAFGSIALLWQCVYHCQGEEYKLENCIRRSFCEAKKERKASDAVWLHRLITSIPVGLSFSGWYDKSLVRRYAELVGDFHRETRESFVLRYMLKSKVTAELDKRLTEQHAEWYESGLTCDYGTTEGLSPLVLSAEAWDGNKRGNSLDAVPENVWVYELNTYLAKEQFASFEIDLLNPDALLEEQIEVINRLAKDMLNHPEVLHVVARFDRWRWIVRRKADLAEAHIKTLNVAMVEI
jgi:hypothetical protein